MPAARARWGVPGETLTVAETPFAAGCCFFLLLTMGCGTVSCLPQLLSVLLVMAEVEVIEKSSTGGTSASVGRSTLNGDANPFVLNLRSVSESKKLDS